MKIKYFEDKSFRNSLNVKNEGDKAQLYLYGDICTDWIDAWLEDGAYPLGVKEFLDNNENKDIEIYINSGGGSVFAGMAIYNMLKRCKGKKTVHVDGIAASISSVIALAGDEIIIPSNAYFMIHNPSVGLKGDYATEELITISNELEVIKTGIVNAYVENAAEGITEQKLQELMDAETWFTGADAGKIFNLKVSQEKQYQASLKNFSNYKKIPEELKKIFSDTEKTPEKAENEVSTQTEKNEGQNYAGDKNKNSHNADDEDKRAKILRTYLSAI